MEKKWSLRLKILLIKAVSNHLDLAHNSLTVSLLTVSGTVDIVEARFSVVFAYLLQKPNHQKWDSSSLATIFSPLLYEGEALKIAPRVNGAHKNRTEALNYRLSCQNKDA